jgi:prepilin-type N-terminal cleavage/methylation domain-containing protein
MDKRRGWTMIELLVVIVVMGVLSSLAVLKYIDLTRTAMTSRIVGEFVAVRLAAYNYEADNNNMWPAEVGPGVEPPELNPYLPAGFQFNNPSYTLYWDNLGTGGPYQIGISMTTTDARLMNAIVQTLGSKAPYFVVGNTLTYVLIDPNGNY